MKQISTRTLSTNATKASELSEAVSDLASRVGLARDWKWFVTGTYRGNVSDTCLVLRDFREWLRHSTLMSANKQAPYLAYRVVNQNADNKTPTDRGHRLARRGPAFVWRGKAKQKFSKGQWRASYCVAVEPHQRAGLHWHAVISDPIGAPYTLDWDVLRSTWLDRHGRVDVQAVRTADDAAGYVTKSLSYTMKQGTDLEFSPDLERDLASSLCPI